MENTSYSRRQFVERLAGTTAGIATFGSSQVGIIGCGGMATAHMEALLQMKQSDIVDSVAEIPDTFNMMLDYPEKTTVMLVSSLANDTPIRHVIRGHKATPESTGCHQERRSLKCDQTLGFYGVVACMMGVQSLRHRKYLKWDPQNETVIEN